MAPMFLRYTHIGMFALVILLLVPSRVLSKVVQFGVSFFCGSPSSTWRLFFLVSLSSSQKRGTKSKEDTPSYIGPVAGLPR